MPKSQVRRAFQEDGAHKTHIGGQALLEGIMMRGKQHWSVAVREPGGQIYTECHSLRQKRQGSWMGFPLIRGCVALVDSLMLGYRALAVSAGHAFSEEDNQDESEGEFGKGAMALSLVLGLALGIALFIILPALLSNVVVGDYDTNPLAWNILDGIARVAIFIFYVWLIGHMSDIRRMFAYHGAEHKTIHCYEHGLELTVQNAQQFPCLHVRCGTAFLIMVMILAILVYTIMPLDVLIASLGITDSVAKFVLVIAARIVLLPLIAGISYEITVKWAGSHPENPLVKIVLWPGMQMQRLTTNEPDSTQLECALVAMKLVLEKEE